MENKQIENWLKDQRTIAMKGRDEGLRGNYHIHDAEVRFADRALAELERIAKLRGDCVKAEGDASDIPNVITHGFDAPANPEARDSSEAKRVLKICSHCQVISSEHPNRGCSIGKDAWHNWQPLAAEPSPTASEPEPHKCIFGGCPECMPTNEPEKHCGRNRCPICDEAKGAYIRNDGDVPITFTLPPDVNIVGSREWRIEGNSARTVNIKPEPTTTSTATGDYAATVDYFVSCKVCYNLVGSSGICYKCEPSTKPELSLLLIDLGEYVVMHHEEGFAWTLAVNEWEYRFDDDRDTHLARQSFVDIRSALDAMDTPPDEPYIERCNPGYRVRYGNRPLDGGMFWLQDELDAVTQLAGKPLPIYEKGGKWVRLGKYNDDLLPYMLLFTAWRYTR